MVRIKIITLFILLSLLLSCCSDNTKRSLGLLKKDIDEFQVIKKAPLSLPLNISIRPPGKKYAKKMIVQGQ